MPYKLIGRTTDFKGKSLWEILGNLKKFGVGRIVARNTFQRYSEPTYDKIIKVETVAALDSSIEIRRKVTALVEKTFRSKKSKKPVQLESSTYKTDYFLIHKYSESKFSKVVQFPVKKFYSDKMEFPPLIKEIIIRQMKAKKLPIIKEPMMKIIYNKSRFKIYEEMYKVEMLTKQKLHVGLGIPATPRLYQNLIK